MTVKFCTSCDRLRELKDFAKDGGPSGLRPDCNFCRSRKRKEAYQKPGAKAAASVRHRERTYGLSAIQVARMSEAQDDACAACGDEFNGVRAPHVDHNHTTGKVRGLLCSGCNTAVGMVKEDRKRLQALIAYLDKHSDSGKRD